MTWKPFLDIDNTDAIRDKLSEIATTLISDKVCLSKKNGLFNGKIGIALFFFYYARYTQCDVYSDYAAELVESVLDTIDQERIGYTFSEGLAGIGWALEHLIQQRFLEFGTNEILTDLDQLLLKALDNYVRQGNYSYYHGALGIGIYFLNRPLNDTIRKHLICLVEGLEKMATMDSSGGIKWVSSNQMIGGETVQNGSEVYLGVAAGMAGIIAFLARAGRLGVGLEKVNPLLEGAIRYLLRQKLNKEEFASIFPILVSDEAPPRSSRLMWSYGDHGIGRALWLAACDMENRELKNEALGLLLHSAKRMDYRKERVLEAGLATGPAGLALIFHRMYQEKQEDSFRDVARFWYRAVVGMGLAEGFPAGYKFWKGPNNGGWQSDMGLLNGISGIGLVLISAISEIEPKWSECFFI